MKNYCIALITLMSMISLTAQAQSDSLPGAKEVKQWFKKKEWAQGFTASPSKTINLSTFFVQYHRNKEAWEKAFAFLAQTNLKSLKPGKYPIDGEQAYASVTENPSKDFDSTSWESHRKYIDIQYVIEGEELIGVHPADRATVTKTYDEKKDVMNYSVTGKVHKATSETFFIFFPADAHRPNITPGGNKPVKKIVVKIRVA